MKKKRVNKQTVMPLSNCPITTTFVHGLLAATRGASFLTKGHKAATNYISALTCMPSKATIFLCNHRHII